MAIFTLIVLIIAGVIPVSVPRWPVWGSLFAVWLLVIVVVSLLMGVQFTHVQSD